MLEKGSADQTIHPMILYRTWINCISAWISNHMLNEMWHEITYPVPNLNGCTIEVCELLELKLNYVNKGPPSGIKSNSVYDQQVARK